jgi:hypothetical protein
MTRRATTMRRAVAGLAILGAAGVSYALWGARGREAAELSPERSRPSERPPTLLLAASDDRASVLREGAVGSVSRGGEVSGEIEPALRAAFAGAPKRWSANRTWLARTYATMPGGAPALAKWHLRPGTDPELRALAEELIVWFFALGGNPTYEDYRAFQEAVLTSTTAGMSDALLFDAGRWLAYTRLVPLAESERARLAMIFVDAAARSSPPEVLLWSAAHVGLRSDDVTSAVRTRLAVVTPDELLREARYWRHPAFVDLLLADAGRISVSTLEKLEASKDEGLVHLGFRLRLRASRDVEAALAVLRRGPSDVPLTHLFGSALVAFVVETDGDSLHALPPILRSRSGALPTLLPLLDERLQSWTGERLAEAIERGEVEWDRAEVRIVPK